MICLSKNLSDEYINKFAHGAGLPIYDYDNYPSDGTILIRSMGKRKLIKESWTNNRDFYYMDSGYVGNYKSKSNPNGWKDVKPLSDIPKHSEVSGFGKG